MTKRRRIFDVDLPEEPVATTGPRISDPLMRRGPMATAIGENAQSLRERQTQEAAIRSENDALAHEFVRLKKLGLVTDLIPIDAVVTGKLLRDRSARLDPELADLKASIRAVGLSNPIRVEQTGPGSYELVQGWRRLMAYRELYAETADPIFAKIPAGLMARGETLESLYRRMVDENMVRKDISFAEMANLARAFADDQGSEAVDLDQAVNLLFASAAPQKRSYIRRFAALMQALEKVLEFPEAIPRALGVTLSQMMETQSGMTAEVARALQATPRPNAEAELAVLRRFVNGEAAVAALPRQPRLEGNLRRGKTTLRLPHQGGEVKCTASPGKVELRCDRDFSTIERARLEAAIEAFLNALD